MRIATVPLVPPATPVPFDAGRWQVSALQSRVEEHLGRTSLFLKGGVAVAADAGFADGSLDFDVAFTRARGFVGGIWRVQDAGNYEEFYLRPHQSGNPDATQYTPVFNGVSGWQLYHGPRHAVPVTHRFEEWTHVRILFAGTVAEVYVDDMETPALFVDELRRGTAPGGVGVSAGQGAPAHFSNVSFLPGTPAIRGRAGAPEPAPDGVVASWQVSEPFRESALEGRTRITASDLADVFGGAGQSWTRLDAERSGLANLARVHGLRPRRNTVLARCTLVSDREQIKRLDFGFSDRVRVYLNGALLFRGDDTYQSRDYRFLGSIGYFDSLYLPLRIGGNELLMAVSEDLGGWGIQAKLEDLVGIIFQD